MTTTEIEVQYQLDYYLILDCAKRLGHVPKKGRGGQTFDSAMTEKIVAMAREETAKKKIRRVIPQVATEEEVDSKPKYRGWINPEMLKRVADEYTGEDDEEDEEYQIDTDEDEDEEARLFLEKEKGIKAELNEEEEDNGI